MLLRNFLQYMNDRRSREMSLDLPSYFRYVRS